VFVYLIQHTVVFHILLIWLYLYSAAVNDTIATNSSSGNDSLASTTGSSYGDNNITMTTEATSGDDNVTNTTQTSSGQTTTSGRCLCPCSSPRLIPDPLRNMTIEHARRHLRDKLAETRHKLAVNKTKLSSTIRKKTSAKDERPSAIGSGGVGIAIFVLVFGSLLLLDFSTLAHDVKMMIDSIRNFVNR
jgi:hypothetical protein